MYRAIGVDKELTIQIKLLPESGNSGKEGHNKLYSRYP